MFALGSSRQVLKGFSLPKEDKTQRTLRAGTPQTVPSSSHTPLSPGPVPFLSQGLKAESHLAFHLHRDLTWGQKLKAGIAHEGWMHP